MEFPLILQHWYICVYVLMVHVITFKLSQLLLPIYTCILTHMHACSHIHTHAGKSNYRARRDGQ